MRQDLASKQPQRRHKPAPQKKPEPLDLIRDTRDVKILKNSHIRALFDEKKHRIKHHLNPQASPSKASRNSVSPGLDDDRTKGFALQKEAKESARLEGDIFQFTNKDRYKSKQLTEQALALLVPGYLQFAFNIST